MTLERGSDSLDVREWDRIAHDGRVKMRLIKEEGTVCTEELQLDPDFETGRGEFVLKDPLQVRFVVVEGTLQVGIAGQPGLITYSVGGTFEVSRGCSVEIVANESVRLFRISDNSGVSFWNGSRES